MIAGALIIDAVLDALAKRFRWSPDRIAAAGALVTRAVTFDLAITQTLYQDAFAKANALRHENIDAAIGGFEQQIGALLGDLKGASGSLFARAEVKALADQTARATKDISLQIAAVQKAAERSTGQISGIVERMKDMSSFTSAIATSVQQQAAATRSISEAVRVVADHSSRAKEGVGEIERIAGQNVATAAEIIEWTSRLSAGANNTERQIDEFFAQVRSA